ncbi:MAG: DUF5049 domain-containing protein [Clostridia bacterium]|nr:DUF5049 domain-containing protein [Clostridia bacterium]
MTDKIKEQIIAIRDSGETNMFDTRMVQKIANREEYHELVLLIEENRLAYLNFILNGEENNE